MKNNAPNPLEGTWFRSTLAIAEKLRYLEAEEQCEIIVD